MLLSKPSLVTALSSHSTMCYGSVQICLPTGLYYLARKVLLLSEFTFSVLIVSAQKIGHKRVMLFTDNDNPHRDSVTLQVRQHLLTYVLLVSLFTA